MPSFKSLTLVHVDACGCECWCGCAWRAGSNLWELVLPFYGYFHGSSSGARVDSKHPYLLSHLNGPVEHHFHIYSPRLLRIFFQSLLGIICAYQAIELTRISQLFSCHLCIMPSQPHSASVLLCLLNACKSSRDWGHHWTIYLWKPLYRGQRGVASPKDGYHAFQASINWP